MDRADYEDVELYSKLIQGYEDGQAMLTNEKTAFAI